MEQLNVSDEVLDRVARAVNDAYAMPYSIRLVRLLDGISTYHLDFNNGDPPEDFDSHEEALIRVVRRRDRLIATAAITAIQERPR